MPIKKLIQSPSAFAQYQHDSNGKCICGFLVWFNRELYDDIMKDNVFNPASKTLFICIIYVYFQHSSVQTHNISMIKRQISENIRTAKRERCSTDQVNIKCLCVFHFVCVCVYVRNEL